MHVNYNTFKSQDVKLSASLMFGICNFTYSTVTTNCVGGYGLRRTKSHWNLVSLLNTFDFLCEYHSALTRACLLMSYQRFLFLPTDCVLRLVLFNPEQQGALFKQ